MHTLKLFLTLTIVSAAYAVNCGIEGQIGSEIITDPVLETTPPESLVWKENTFNVTAAASIGHPHVPYLTGLRYSTRYEYVTSARFNDFLKEQHTGEILRTVQYTCSDGETIIYNFRVPVIDENTEKPTFDSHFYNATYSLSDGSTEPINANIVLSDADYELENADVIVRSSNINVTPFVDPTWTGEHPQPYTYRIDFLVSEALTVGNYDVILTADDGKFSDYTILTLSVVP